MMTDEELAEYYDTHSIMEDYIEAKKNGDVIYCKAGENPIEAMRKHRAEKAARAAKTKRAATPAFTANRVSTRRHVAAVAAM